MNIKLIWDVSSPVERLGQATSALGRTVAPHIRRHSENLLPASFTEKKDGRSTLDGIAEVAVSGVQGNLSVIYRHAPNES